MVSMILKLLEPPIRIGAETVDDEGIKNSADAIADLKVKLSINTHYIYIFRLFDAFIPYPKAYGRVIYIGEFKRSENPYMRNHHQLQFTNNTQNNIGIFNYANEKGIELSHYTLISESPTEELRKEIESQLLSTHTKRYGCLPICNKKAGNGMGNGGAQDAISQNINDLLYLL